GVWGVEWPGAGGMPAGPSRELASTSVAGAAPIRSGGAEPNVSPAEDDATGPLAPTAGTPPMVDAGAAPDVLLRPGTPACAWAGKSWKRAGAHSGQSEAGAGVEADGAGIAGGSVATGSAGLTPQVGRAAGSVMLRTVSAFAAVPDAGGRAPGRAVD